MKRIFVIAGAALVLASCGGGSGSKYNKDTKADFTLTIAAMDENPSDSLYEQKVATIKTYDDKIIEVKGIIKSSEKAEHAGDPNKYSFYLCEKGTDEDTDCLICYTDKDPAEFVGKAVTIKGKGSYAGVMTLVDCAVF